MTLSDLPALNACLNGASTIFLLLGFYFIKQQKRIAHRNCMISAFCTSVLFLVSYLIYHYNAGRTVFADPAWFRPIYLVILLTHTVLAVVIVPLVFMSLSRAYRANSVSPLVRQESQSSGTGEPVDGSSLGKSADARVWDAHKRISRWTLPLWLYVSVTGVLIYLLLYQIFPQK